MKISHSFVTLAVAAAAAVLCLGAVSGWALGTVRDAARRLPPARVEADAQAALADEARQRASHLCGQLLEAAIARGETEAAALVASIGTEIDAFAAWKANLGEPGAELGAAATAAAAADVLQAIADRRASDATRQLHADAAQQALQKAVEAATAMRQAERVAMSGPLASALPGDKLVLDLRDLAGTLRLALAAPITAERASVNANLASGTLKRTATRLTAQAASLRQGLDRKRPVPPAPGAEGVHASLTAMLAAVDQAAALRQREPDLDRSATAALARLQASVDAQASRAARRRADDALRQAARERQRASEVDASAREANQAIAAGAAAGLVALGLVAWLAARRVAGGLRRAVEAAEAMARGEAPARAAEAVVPGPDETSRLLSALHALDGRLAHLADEARSAAATAAAGSDRIADDRRDLGRCRQVQAEQLRRTSMSIDRLASHVKAGKAAARQAAEAMAATGDTAARGHSIVGEVAATMNEIEVSSKQIADITAVIDGLAFQTRLLALNAAVEAARAGPLGRGFAVVASEVRTLADKSAASARDIKLVIGVSRGRVRAGATGVQAAAATMGQIVAQVRHSSGLIDAIADTGAAQSRALTDAGAALGALDDTIRRSAAPAERGGTAAPSRRAA